MATKEITLRPINVASVERLAFPLSKNDEPWLGIDSVVFRFEAPDRSTTFDRAGVLETPDAGVWYYDTTITDFPDSDSVGMWTIGVFVTDGTVVKRYNYEIALEVVSHP
jgi:hypothetical protein